MKKFLVKIYDKTGSVFLKAFDGESLMNEPSFGAELNGGEDHF